MLRTGVDRKTAVEMFKELGFRKNTSICYGVDHIVYEKAIGSEDVH